MELEKLLSSGESINVEFKEALPEKSIKYMKSVIGFANGKGGKIIFGISDATKEVVGIDKDSVFKIMDSITNAISDSCEPAIIPDISFQTVDDKTIIVVEIEAGRQRPYFIKSLGQENGVYVRVAGTTRLADSYMIKELMFEGYNRSYDQAIYLGLEITEKEINALCKSLKQTAINNARTDEEKRTVKDVTIHQLLAWGVLTEKDGKLFPTNAYTLLTGTNDVNYAIQCGLFKGTNKALFIDKREFDGPIQDQIEQTYQFVLRNIHLGANIEGIYRKDVYEISPTIIRELIINSAVHRSYLDHGNIQVAIFDDRLEITTPGKLPLGQTIDRMKQGYSKIRNEALANAFSYMNLIEHWGSGIPRIIQGLKELGLKEPEFIGGDVDLRINIYRSPNNTNNSDKNLADDLNDLKDDLNDLKDDLNSTEIKLLQIIKKSPKLSQKEIGIKLNVSEATVKRMLNKLKNDKIVIREGSKRSGKWIIQ